MTQANSAQQKAIAATTLLHRPRWKGPRWNCSSVAINLRPIGICSGSVQQYQAAQSSQFTADKAADAAANSPKCSRYMLLASCYLRCTPSHATEAREDSSI